MIFFSFIISAIIGIVMLIYSKMKIEIYKNNSLIYNFKYKKGVVKVIKCKDEKMLVLFYIKKYLR